MSGTLALAADMTTDPGTPSTVRWVSSDPSRGTVNAAGVVTGIAAGTTTITAIADADTTRRATTTLTVVPRVTGLQVVPGTASMRVTETQQLVATVAGDSGVVTSVTWQSANSSVATVNASGLVTAVAGGQIVVTATSTADTTRKASASITVVPRVNAVTVEPTAQTLLVAGTTQLNAMVTGDPGVSTAVTWRSADPSIATVSGSGVVTGVANGQVVVTAISAQDSTRRGNATITVQPRVSGVALGQSGTQNMLVGATLTLTAMVAGDPGVSQGVTWSSSNAAVATVSAGGVVTGVAPGTVTITVRSAVDPTRSATITVIVLPRVTGVSVSPTPTTVNINGTRQLAAVVAGDAGVNQAVTWSTANPALATVNVSGLVTGVAAGSVVITAHSVADPTKSASASVTVSGPVTLQCIVGLDPNADFGAPGSTASGQAICMEGINSMPIGSEVSLGVKTTSGTVVAATFSTSNPTLIELTPFSSTTTRAAVNQVGPTVVTITATTAHGTLSWTFTVPAYGASNRAVPGVRSLSPTTRRPTRSE